MTAAKDWAQKAASKIAELWPSGVLDRLTEEQRKNVAHHLATLITANGPRCDTCKHWQPMVSGKTGDCNNILPSILILDLPGIFGCVQWEAK